MFTGNGERSVGTIELHSVQRSTPTTLCKAYFCQNQHDSKKHRRNSNDHAIVVSIRMFVPECIMETHVKKVRLCGGIVGSGVKRIGGDR